MLRRKVICLVLAAAGGSTACVPPASGNDQPVSYSEESVMGRIQAAGRLVVALPSDRPPFGIRPRTEDGAPGGFSAAVAEEIAQSLDVELEVRYLPNDELLTVLRPPVDPTADEPPAPDPSKVDVVFPLIPITEEIVKQKTFAYTNPYFVGRQRLLVPQGSAVRSVGDLKGKTVCQVIDLETGVDLLEVTEDVEVVVPPAGSCVPSLKKGKADAATASDAVLAGWLHALGPGYQVVGDGLSTVGYGAVLQAGASSWREFVNAQIAEFKSEGRWLEAYEKWITPTLGPPPPEPPTMSVEEAAALYPAPGS